MESIVFKFFGTVYEWIGILLIAGTFASALVDIQRLAFDGKRRGLVSVSAINHQLVGKTK